MKVRNPIEPLIIAPRRRILPAMLASALLTSVVWAIALHEERVTSERLLAEKQARMMRVDAIVVKYANRTSSVVTLKERQ